MKYNHLNVPTHWRNYWTRYPEGHTILEALISLVSQVDSMVDNQNTLNENVEQFRNEIDDFIGRFDEHLQDEVTRTLKDWQQSGFLDVVINEAITTKYHEMDERLTKQLAQMENDKASKTYVETILMDIAKGGPQGLFNSVSELTTTYPDGKEGTWLVFDGTFDDGAHSFMWDSTNSTWKDLGVYQATGIANKTVTPAKTTFYQVDIHTTLTPQTYISYSSGNVVSIQNNYHSSDFIPFDYVGVPMVINTNTASDSSGLAFYDKDKKFISGVQTGGNKSGFDETRFIAPKNTAYIRYTISGAIETSNFYIAFADDTYKLIESMLDKYSFITQFVDLDFESNFYWTRSGNKVAHNSTNFGVTSMEVSKGETFRISGRVSAIDKLYVLENKQGDVIDYFPSETVTSPTVFNDVELKIPEDGLLKIGKYSIDTTLQVLPLFRLDKPSSETKSVDSEYLKHLLLSALLIGDSITRGAYYSPDKNGQSVAENYPYYLGKMTGWSTTNAGVSGITTSGWFDNESTKYNYSTFDTVVINLGTNGGLTNTLVADTSYASYSQYADTNTGSYCKIIEKIKEENPNMFIFLTNVTSTSGDLEITNNVIKQIANKYNLPVIDLMHFKGDPVIHPFGNNVHYGKVGNIELAKTVLDGITGDIEKNPSKYELLLL